MVVTQGNTEVKEVSKSLKKKFEKDLKMFLKERDVLLAKVAGDESAVEAMELKLEMEIENIEKEMVEIENTK